MSGVFLDFAKKKNIKSWSIIYNIEKIEKCNKK